MILKEVGKDRRCKLSKRQVADINWLYYREGFTITKIHRDFYTFISRQRISQVVDVANKEWERRRRQAKRHMLRYQTDDDYREKFLEAKRQSYKYKRKIWVKLGKKG